MRVAALDLGSNTSLLLVADFIDGRIANVFHDETRVTKMGQGVHADRRFHPDALKRVRAAMADYSQVIQQHKCERVVAVATSAARDVANGYELIDMGHEFGIPVHIVPGEVEAQLTFRGALWDRQKTDQIAVIDVGGGSTEIICERSGRPVGQSLDIGSVRLTELFVRNHPTPKEQLQQVENYAQSILKKLNNDFSHIEEVVAVAGTPTTLAALDQQRDFDEKLVHGYKLKLPQIRNWIERLSELTVEQREKLPGMQPKRADVIVSGSQILAESVAALGHNEITVSTFGVRYGVVLACQDF